jgi:hypothetical protein
VSLGTVRCQILVYFGSTELANPEMAVGFKLLGAAESASLIATIWYSLKPGDLRYRVRDGKPCSRSVLL